jgi:cell division protein FtsB
MQERAGLFHSIARFLKYNLRLTLVLVFFLILISFAMFGNKGILQRMKLESERESLEMQLQEEIKKSADLQREVNELKSSDKKIEAVAREKYGMTKEGEKIQKIVIDSTK